MDPLARREKGERESSIGRTGLEEGLVLFDAECPMCRACVGFFGRRDRRGRLRFVSLETAEGREASARAAVDPRGPGSLVFVDAAGCLKESAAVLGMLSRLGGVWRAMAWAGKGVPKSVADRAYRWVAARRSRWSGAASGSGKDRKR